MLKILQEKHFKKDIKKFKNNTKIQKEINNIVLKLANNTILNKKYKNHSLKGNYINCYDCHILPDLVLIYEINTIELKLIRIGNHSELFN